MEGKTAQEKTAKVSLSFLSGQACFLAFWPFKVTEVNEQKWNSKTQAAIYTSESICFGVKVHLVTNCSKTIIIVTAILIQIAPVLSSRTNESIQ